ncbi:MAG: glutathione S-transferase family protein [Myxococcota bacterium]|nr:glutathione S-transferase family protein [Myxococcota bacterium]
MLELYHNAASTCSQKVRMVLEEKSLDYTSRPIDLIAGEQHDPAYVKLNPNHVVPTLIHEGRALIESSLINEYLDDAFPKVPMKPGDPAGRHAMRLWVKRFDQSTQGAIGVVTFAIGPRRLILDQPEEVREANLAAIPDPARRAVRRSVIEHGIHAPEFDGAMGTLVELLDDMETALAGQNWLTGNAFGLADAGVLPYVLRLDHLAMTPLLSADVRPKVADWYARVQARPAFTVAVSEWLPEPLLNVFRSGGEAVWGQVERLIQTD